MVTVLYLQACLYELILFTQSESTVRPVSCVAALFVLQSMSKAMKLCSTTGLVLVQRRVCVASGFSHYSCSYVLGHQVQRIHNACTSHHRFGFQNRIIFQADYEYI